MALGKNGPLSASQHLLQCIKDLQKEARIITSYEHIESKRHVNIYIHTYLLMMRVQLDTDPQGGTRKVRGNLASAYIIKIPTMYMLVPSNNWVGFLV